MSAPADFGFLATNLLIFGSSLMATAAVANALAGTLGYLMPIFNDQLFRIAFFIFIFSGLAIVNIIGVKKGISLVKLITMAKLAPLLLLVIWGSTKIIVENLTWHGVPAFNEIGQVSLLLFFAFQGAESSLSVGGEVKKPKKTVPKAIMLSFIIILMLYIVIQLVSQGILGDSFASYKDAPLAEVANRIMGPMGITLMIVGAAISMFGYLSSDTLNIPRVLFRSAMDKVIPVRQLSFVHSKYATPYVAVIVYTTLGCFFAITGEFKHLAILSSSSVLLLYLGVALTVVKFRLMDKSEKDSFKIPGGYLVPILAVITILWLLSNLTGQEMTSMLIALSILSTIFLLIKYFKLDK